jgi:hypothetical protein
MFKLREYHKEKSYKTYAFNVRTPWEDEDSRTNYCLLNIQFGKRSWWWQIPPIIKPVKKWVDTSKEVWSTNPKGGYWDYIAREYGFTVSEGHLHLHYGIQPGSWSSKDKKNSDHTKVFYIPWSNNTFMGETYFTPEWFEYWTVEPLNQKGALDFDSMELIRKYVPKFHIKFDDFDSEKIIATCYITMTKYHRGVSWCRWLKYFTKPIRICRLYVDYDKETGYEKGSWKGGILGHSIPLKYQENPVETFQRYGAESGSYKYHGIKPRSYSNIEVIR